MRFMAAIFLSLILSAPLIAEAVTNAADDEVKFRAMLKVLKDYTPPGQRINEQYGKNHSYILSGDLFENGNIYALVGFSFANGEHTQSDLGLCQWNGKKWEARNVLGIDSMWDAKGIYSEDELGFSMPLATKPVNFMTVAGHREIVVAREIERFRSVGYQYFSMLQFDADTNQIDLIGVSKERPKTAGVYVILKEDSGRRAIWGEHTYMRRVNNKLILISSWRDEAPYDGQRGFQAVTNYDKDGNEAEYFIIYDGAIIQMPKDYGELDYGANLPVSSNFAKGKIYARLSFIDLSKRDEYNHVTLTNAYIFEKLTGIPRKLFPDFLEEGNNKPAAEDITRAENLETIAHLKIQGTPEAVKRLSFKKKISLQPPRKRT